MRPMLTVVNICILLATIPGAFASASPAITAIAGDETTAAVQVPNKLRCKSLSSMTQDFYTNRIM